MAWNAGAFTTRYAELLDFATHHKPHMLVLCEVLLPQGLYLECTEVDLHEITNFLKGSSCQPTSISYLEHTDV